MHLTPCQVISRMLCLQWTLKREYAQVCSCFCKKCYSFNLGEISFKISYGASISQFQARKLLQNDIYTTYICSIKVVKDCQRLQTLLTESDQKLFCHSVLLFDNYLWKIFCLKAISSGQRHHGMRRSPIPTCAQRVMSWSGLGWEVHQGWAGTFSSLWLLSGTNPDVLFYALKDISSLLSQVKRSQRKQVPNSSPYRSSGQQFSISTVSADKPCSLLCVLH